MTRFTDIKEYLLDLDFEIISEDTANELVIIRKENSGIDQLIIDCEEPLIIFEYPFFKIDLSDGEACKELLIKNRDIIHGAFAVTDEGMLIFRDTLQLENLDKNELEGTLNSLELLLAEYGNRLIELAN